MRSNILNIKNISKFRQIFSRFEKTVVLTLSKGRQTMSEQSESKGFTIVELIVVISVIGILAAIGIVSYNSWQQTIMVTQISSDLNGVSAAMENARTFSDVYPIEIPSTFTPSGDGDVLLSGGGSPDGKWFCIDAVSSQFPSLSYHIDSASISQGAQTGTCPVDIQTITTANCPSTRTQVHDARDGHTYWVQKLADNKCWMLTNLGYAGGGTNTYSDVITLTNGTGGSATYTVASYYVTPLTTNYTTEPTAPSTSTDGTGQYGYLYNFCGANGGQTGNGACSDASSTAVNTAISICPYGWRLPIGNGGDFGALNNAINGGLTNTDAGLIGTPWLAQRGGSWGYGFGSQGSSGYYWSSTQYSAAYAYSLYFSSAGVYPASGSYKYVGFAVRCMAV